MPAFMFLMNLPDGPNSGRQVLLKRFKVIWKDDNFQNSDWYAYLSLIIRLYSMS